MAERLDDVDNDENGDSKQDSIVPKAENMCSAHPKNHLEVFCNVCKVPVCHECALWGKHQGHRFVPRNESNWNTTSRQQCVGVTSNDKAPHTTKEGMLAYLEDCGAMVSEAIVQVQRQIDSVHAEWNTIEKETSQTIHDMFDRLGESATAELQMLEDNKARYEAQAEKIIALTKDISAKTWSSEDERIRELIQHQRRFQIESISSKTSSLVSEIIPAYTSVTLKIQNFQELRSCNLKVYSRPLRVDGLVWKLRVYPNGYGEGKGKYLSVFAELSSGNGTTINYQYCIEILHSSGRSVHYRQYVSDFSDGGSWGYTKFYLLSKLEEEGIISDDDTLVLKFGIRAPTYHLKCCQLAMHNQRLEGTVKSLRRRLRTMQQSLIMHKTEGLLEDDKCPTITCSKMMQRQRTTSSSSPSSTLPRSTTVQEQATLTSDLACGVPRPNSVATPNQVEITVKSNKTEASNKSNHGNQVVLQLQLCLDPDMNITLKKPGEDQVERQESLEPAVTRDWSPVSSTTLFSWPASRHHSLERPRPQQWSSLERSCSMPTSSIRPHQRGAEETIVEIPDCFDLTKPLAGYVPRRWAGLVPIRSPPPSVSGDDASPDCCMCSDDHTPLHTDDHTPLYTDGHTSGGSPQHADNDTPIQTDDHTPLCTITGTTWPCGDEVIPVTSSRREDIGGTFSGPDSSLFDSQLMHTVTSSGPQASGSDRKPVPKVSRSPTKGLQMGDASCSSQHLPPRPNSFSPPYPDLPNVDNYLLPPPEEWGGGGHS